MLRSRSSFDLSAAITTATSLATSFAPSHATGPGEKGEPFRGVTLVSFGGPPPAVEEGTARPPPPVHPVAEPSMEESLAESVRRPPKLPELTGIASTAARCDKIIDWIAEATGATEVFLADASGLPIAGAITEGEARLAGAGLVASAVAQLAAALPGASSPLFELHLGEGPYFQMIGFQAAEALYLVGFLRPQPLSPRQIHAIRLACRHALGDALGGRR